ncbi:MAG: TVP38/TMEM64 family protein, partial [Myxococcota bacterium]
MAEAKAVQSPRRWLVPALALVALLAVGWLVKPQAAAVAAWLSEQLLVFAQWVKTLGPAGPLVFIAGYALAVVGFVPASLLTIGAGTIFGVVAGTAWVFIAATLGACAAFMLARTVARGAVERRILANPRFAAIDGAIAKDGRKIAVLLRLSPVIPFTLLNYALGLTRIRFADYAIACIAMLPGTLLYVYIGSLVG